MNLLFINDRGISGSGAEIRLKLLITELLKERTISQIHLIEHCSSQSDQSTLRGITTHRISTRGSGKLTEELIQKHNISIVQVHNLALLSTRPINAAKKLHKPIIFSAHDYWAFCGRRDLLYQGKKPCDGPGILSCSSCIGVPSYLKTLRNISHLNHCDLGIAPSDYVIQTYEQNGILLNKWRKTIPWVAMHRPNTLNYERDCSILFVGSLSTYKGIDSVLQMAALVKRNIPEIKLRIVGDSQETENPHRKRVDTLIQNLSLQNNVLFLGYKNHEEIQQEYVKAGVFVSFPLWAEPSALSLQEAMTLGCPTVVNNCGGIHEFVSPEIVVAKDDILTFAKLTTKILTDKTYAKNIIARNSEYSKHFEPKYASEEFIKIYQDLCN